MNNNELLSINIHGYCKINDLHEKIELIMVYSLTGIFPLNHLYEMIDELKNGSGSHVNITSDSLPNHYSKYKYQPINFILDNKLDFAQGCVVKYLSRYSDKNGDLDLEKVKFYSCCIKTGSFKHYEEYKNNQK